MDRACMTEGGRRWWHRLLDSGAQLHSLCHAADPALRGASLDLLSQLCPPARSPDEVQSKLPRMDGEPSCQSANQNGQSRSGFLQGTARRNPATAGGPQSLRSGMGAPCVARRVQAFVADKLPEESWSRKGTCVSWTLFLRCSFTVAKRPTSSKKELTTLLADFRSFPRNGVEVLLTPDDRF